MFRTLRCPPLALAVVLLLLTPQVPVVVGQELAGAILDPAQPMPSAAAGATDADALLETAESLGGSLVSDLPGPWTADAPHCTWTGVTCNSDSKVTYVASALLRGNAAQRPCLQR